jgi:hypothetical protein
VSEHLGPNTPDPTPPLSEERINEEDFAQTDALTEARFIYDLYVVADTEGRRAIARTWRKRGFDD